jgi:hypothetical protein
MTRSKLALFAAVALMAPLASAGMIEINMADTNLTITDADGGGAGTGTLASTGGTDALIALTFKEDATPLGVLSVPGNTLSFDLSVAGVPSIVIPPVNNSTTVTAPAGGTFGLNVNGLPALELDLDTVEIFYTRISAGSFNANFLFSGTVGSITGQDLPFDVELADPVTLSFNVQQLTQATSQGFLTSFLGSGSGTIMAARVPEPSSVLIAGLGGLLAIAGVRARSKK